MDIIKQRKTVEYDMKDLTIIKKESHILSDQIDVNSLKGINIIFENQKQCAKKVRNAFNNRSIINCLVYGMTQTGKTGCMTSLIQYYVFSNNIPIDNIYIITGLSDKEWKKDTKNRMPDSINNRVFHRANLPKTFFKDIREKENLLIIMDEIQIACEEDQTIYKTFNKCGFYDLDFLLNNDIKLIQFSATPDGNINDISDWNNYSVKIKLEPGENYYGPKEALEQNRVKQFKDLTNSKNVKELKPIIETFTEPRYYLIRVPNKRKNKNGGNNQEIVISNFKTIFSKDFQFNENYLKKEKKDINDILKKKPNKHTFIFYCEILRCAKTQCKKYIGISYERFVDVPNDSSIIQGTFGRDTGYDNNGDSICYTNIPSIINYIKLWDNNMEFKHGIKWNTKTTRYDNKDNIAYSKGTFNSVKYIDELKNNCSEKVKEDRGEPKIGKFYGETGQKEMIEWFKNNLKKKMNGKRGPQKKGKKTEGNREFYKGSIRNGLELLSTEKVEKEKKWGLKEGPCYRSYPCYSDITDPTTLQWWLIYYK
uniref:Uncharacterized protein n=1 Tax=viral metagenome TaxID=1070528 RepID=A0A6C0EFV1_9ZZZZ